MSVEGMAGNLQPMPDPYREAERIRAARNSSQDCQYVVRSDEGTAFCSLSGTDGARLAEPNERANASRLADEIDRLRDQRVYLLAERDHFASRAAELEDLVERALPIIAAVRYSPAWLADAAAALEAGA